MVARVEDWGQKPEGKDVPGRMGKDVSPCGLWFYKDQ